MEERRPTAKAELEVALKAGAPEGVLTAEDGRRFPFSGWTELAAVIEEWHSSAQHPPRAGRQPPGKPS